jgi:Ca2+-transporting ATPase
VLRVVHHRIASETFAGCGKVFFLCRHPEERTKGNGMNDRIAATIAAPIVAPQQVPPATAEPADWHALDVSAAAVRLAANAGEGLSAEEARLRLARHGPNALAQKPPRPPWLLFLDQFRNLLVIVLIGAAVLAGSIGDLKDTIVILAVVVLNALLGFYQEFRAEKTLAALKKMLAQSARVRRGGEVLQIPSEALVPGDVVLLEAGDRVPADGRLLAGHNLDINEAVLTGESQAVAKSAERTLAAEVPLAERFNLAYMNTVVTRGRAELLVTATGMRTEMGRLTGMLQEAGDNPTPLQIQLDQLGKRLALIAGAVVSLIFLVGMLRDYPLVQTIMTSIALAVASIPEGLPAVVTVTLAIGMHRMARNRAIVKRLAAVETLGCTTVICSDKTGTLTLNQMTARAVWIARRSYAVSGEGYRGEGAIVADDGAPAGELNSLLLPAALCNDSHIAGGELIGDPTEGALLALAAKGGIGIERVRRASPRLAEIPFDSAFKFMVTFHRDGDGVHAFVKGAPDVLLARSAVLAHAAGELPLDEALRDEVLAANDAFAARAMRVLAVAVKPIAPEDFDPAGDLLQHVRDLRFVGLVGLIDPPRPEARDAIALCRRAGIEVRMITGDHKATAAAIARELGMQGEVATGADLDRMDEAELARRVESIAVFARVAPEHKVRIVDALRARGHVAAMTGDGVNDAPALKHADIGVAMGITGTEVTKEAAAMVLTDDNFATIVGAVKEGRTIYDNMVKFVRFQLSTNFGAIFTVLSATLLGLPTPFTAIQILWVNIIMDGPPAMTLGVDPARPGIMNDPPRKPSARILNGRRLLVLALFGAVMCAGTLGMFFYGRAVGGEAYGLTLAFTTFVIFQFFNVFNARAECRTTFNRTFFSNWKLWMALLAVLLLQVVVVHWAPAQAVFDTVDLVPADWAIAFAVASSVLVVEELRKLVLLIIRREKT